MSLLKKISKPQSFKEQHTFEKRKEEATRILAKYPDRIPVIVEKAEKSDIPQLDKAKFLVPADISVSNFQYVVRKRIKLRPEQSIFLFFNNTLVPSATLMSEVYKQHKSDCGFVFCTYSGENAFGQHILTSE